MWDYEFNRLPKQMHICIHLFIRYRIDAFVLSCLGSHKQARGVYGARAGKENIFLTYKQVMKIFFLPT